MRCFIKFTIFVMVFLLFCSASQANSLKLDEFLVEVTESNLSLRSSLLRAEAMGHRSKPAATLEDPFVAVGIDQIPTDGSPGNVIRYQISQTIPFPGKLDAKSDVAESRAHSISSDAETTRREVLVLGTQAFYRAYYNQQAIELNKKIQNIIESIIESTKARYKTGDVGHHEWLLAKVELNINKVENLRLHRNKQTIQALLNELRNKPAETSLEKLEATFRYKDELLDDAIHIQEQPELKSLNSLLTQAQKEEKLARLSYFPDFVIQAMAMRPSSDMMNEKSNWGVMVGFNIPLFFWRKQTEGVSAAIKDREAATIEKMNLMNRLNSEVIDAKQQFKTASDVVVLYKDSIIPSTNLALENAKTGYVTKRLPLGPFLETLRVQKTQELEYLAAQIDVELAKIRFKNLLASPPVLRLAPLRPSLFGGSSMEGSSSLNMGAGISPGRKKSSTSSPDSSTSDMGGM